VFKHITGWLKAEREAWRSRGRLARWIGRSWARLHYATRVEPTWLELNALEVSVPGLAADFTGLRVVQISDLHCSRRVNGAYLGEAVELAQRQHPDLIALTGDFIHAGYGHIEEAAEVVARCHAPLGVWAVLGNHDYSVRNASGRRRYPDLNQAVADALRRHGIRVLDNESAVISRGQGQLYLVGLSDLWSCAFDPNKALAGLDPHIPRLVLAHNPCSIESMNGHRCDLMLSGHTHGGQVNLPRLGRVALSKRGKRYAAGLYHIGKTWLYVNKGVGVGTFPVRFNVRPEVAVFTLKAVHA
jgi:predicted MPP superfamily phosphohydrolase